MSSPRPAHSGYAYTPDPPRRGPWRLGRLAPAVLAAWLMVDIGLRLFPVEHLGVSPIVAAERLTGRHSPFRANVTIRVAVGSPGENAVRGNLPPTERRPPLRFSTDSLGYRRNPEMAAGAVPDLLVLGGDSFIYGANLSDEETLPAALTRVSGLYAYNAGRSHVIPMTPADLDWLLNQFPEAPRKAVLVHLEQHRRNVPGHGPGSTPELMQDLRYLRWLVQGWWDPSPLRNATRRLFRRLADGRILPNIYGQDVLTYSLPDGSPMLFRGSETFPARVAQDSAKVQETAEYIREWVEALERRGLETYVLLLPTRFTVYGPLLEDGEMRDGVIRAVHDMYHLADELRGNGITTINALRVFQSTAPEDLATGNLPFYREDNHWTPSGVERIARVLTDSLTGQQPAEAPADHNGVVSRANR